MGVRVVQVHWEAGQKRGIVGRGEVAVGSAHEYVVVAALIGEGMVGAVAQVSAAWEVVRHRARQQPQRPLHLVPSRGVQRIVRTLAPLGHLRPPRAAQAAEDVGRGRRGDAPLGGGHLRGRRADRVGAPNAVLALRALWEQRRRTPSGRGGSYSDHRAVLWRRCQVRHEGRGGRGAFRGR